jgi:hypothetical protein
VALQVIESDGPAEQEQKGSSKTHLFILEPTTPARTWSRRRRPSAPTRPTRRSSGAYGLDGAMRVGVFDASITGSGSPPSPSPGSTGRHRRRQLKDEWVVGAHGDSGYIATARNNPDPGARLPALHRRCAEPGAGVEGGFMPEAKTFFAVPYTGRKPARTERALPEPSGHTSAGQPERPPIHHWRGHRR